MRRREAGFALVELIIAGMITALVAGGAGYLIIQTLRNTRETNDRLTAIRHLEKAISVINSDAQAAENVTTTGLTPPNLVVFRWTQWGYNQPSVYHTVTYAVKDVSGNIGRLTRTHQDSSGTNEEKSVAELVYYNTGDAANTTKVAVAANIFTFKVTTRAGTIQESRAYRADSRTSLLH